MNWQVAGAAALVVVSAATLAVLGYAAIKGQHR